MTTTVSLMLEVYGVDPFYSPKKFIKEQGINVDEFENAVKIIKQKQWLVDQPARQYWFSIDSIRNQTNFDRAVINQTAYPSRIGLYPGITCQFACTFCGRKEGTQFANNLSAQSVDMFNQLLADHVQVPNHQKIIRLSGGLEPTTNRHISDIVMSIKRLGLRAEMYTNGFNFTDNWLDLQLGINLLDSIRFSIYGHNEETYTDTTTHTRSHTVLEKIKNFLNRSSMPVGVNYVILRGQLDRFEKFIDWIETVNQSTRGINWVSIREDSSQNKWHLDNDERRRIRDLLLRLDQVSKSVDYGYTLWPLKFDKNIGGITHTNSLLPNGFPQISVVVDVAGDVYSYHDVFPNRAGQNKHVIGNVKENSLQNLITDWLAKPKIQVCHDDLKFLDTSDHMITMLIKQQQELNELGVKEWLV
jgi:dTDP-4-amino-4,6-dideoxy-D-glucose ammonia-lyase